MQCCLAGIQTLTFLFFVWHCQKEPWVTAEFKRQECMYVCLSIYISIYLSANQFTVFSSRLLSEF